MELTLFGERRGLASVGQNICGPIMALKKNLDLIEHIEVKLLINCFIDVKFSTWETFVDRASIIKG